MCTSPVCYTQGYFINTSTGSKAVPPRILSLRAFSAHEIRYRLCCAPWKTVGFEQKPTFWLLSCLSLYDTLFHHHLLRKKNKKPLRPAVMPLTERQRYLLYFTVN